MLSDLARRMPRLSPDDVTECPERGERVADPHRRHYHLRMVRFRISILTLVLAAALTRVASAAIPEPVKTTGGLLTGVPGAAAGVRAFKGVPFAAPPVGDLRWRAPQPPVPWSGVRAGDAFSANCMQRSAGGGAFPPYGGDRSATTMSEDCLYLNVYTAADSAANRRPVMVWIHGGAFTSGAGAIYQGEDLARKGVVVVTVNYRLGVFGFLAHPELSRESPNRVSGNYAFLDQIAALQWVQKNIALFGGDPARVTIFGESAGSWSVNNLVASPLAKGLFHRAIGESGAQFAITRTLQEAEGLGARFAENSGVTSIAQFRSLPADRVNDLRQFPTSATVDGWFLPHDVFTIFTNGAQNDVPVLIGSTSHEGSIFTDEDVTARSFGEQSRRRYGADADAFLSLYPFTSDREARAAQSASMRDSTFGWEMRTWARMQEKSGKSSVFLYYFTHVPPRENSAWYGAQHGAEIPYAFNWPNGKHSLSIPWTDLDRELAEQISSYWVNFATTGNPNGKETAVEWRPYRIAEDRALEIGDALRMVPVPNTPALDFLDRAQQRARLGRAPSSR